MTPYLPVPYFRALVAEGSARAKVARVLREARLEPHMRGPGRARSSVLKARFLAVLERMDAQILWSKRLDADRKSPLTYSAHDIYSSWHHAHEALFEAGRQRHRPATLLPPCNGTAASILPHLR